MDVLTQIQAVTFDVGGTLIEPHPSVGHVYAEVAAGHGWKGLCAETLTRRFKAVWGRHHPFQHSRSEWAQVVDETFCGLVNPPPSRSFFPALFERFAQPDAWKVFEDVFPALDRLASSGLKLGIISNWDERLRPLLHHLKLDTFFEVVVISWEVGFSKPSPIIYEQAVRKLALAPPAILHVGDDPELDVSAARDAGLQARRLSRGGAGVLDGQIHSLDDLGVSS
jgi:putative hydrolase of the HAD superfamily